MSRTEKLQKPSGTRDFFPEDMAWRNYLHDAWRRVSVRNGFDEVDGPIYEHLDLYKVKSGDGIVSELFSFRREGGKNDYAIRPEFTPTLARMVAERANALPRPIKWFCVPNLCRAERPQRGRLREFFQWNCDLIGVDGARADAEVIFTVVDLLRELGLQASHVKVKISHRDTVRHILLKLGVPESKMLQAFDLLDRRAKISDEQFLEQAKGLDLNEDTTTRFDQICRMKWSVGKLGSLAGTLGAEADLSDLQQLDDELQAFGIGEWCEYDLGIVRGLAYYTGTVFEVHESTGAERAIAGGGRYDKLIELFGGPSMPAVGFGMGDVVIENVLKDKGLIPEDVAAKPDVFVVSLSELGDAKLSSVVAQLRGAGLHARFTYKTTRNLGKLIKDANNTGARKLLLLDDKVGASGSEGTVGVKDLASGEQTDVALTNLIEAIQARAV